MVSSLLAAGADPNAANTGGQRPIHYAASKGRMDVIRKLVAAGCEPDVKDRTKSTPLARRGANLGVEDSEGANVATLAPKLVSALRAIKQGDAYL